MNSISEVLNFSNSDLTYGSLPPSNVEIIDLDFTTINSIDFVSPSYEPRLNGAFSI